MKKIGRNAPCSCGSGKKYKRCCLARDRLDDRRWKGLDRALEWLNQRYGEAIWEELSEVYWGTLGSALMVRYSELPQELRASLDENSDEWLVAEARLQTAKRRVPLIDLILSSGPSLDEIQRRWLASFAENPLGIYEIREVGPAGMVVADLADPERCLLEVTGAAIPPEADEPSALVGMRLLADGEKWMRTIAWYPFERSLLPQIEEAVARARAEWEGPEDRRWFLGSLIAELWWNEKARAHLSPEEVEKAIKSEFRRVTDIYRVGDWERLGAVLVAADLVEGSRELGWTHFEHPEGAYEPIWIQALNPGPGDRLGVFATSELWADEGRLWLAELAGDLVDFERREIRDPAEDEVPAVLLEGWGDAPAATKTARIQQILESNFAGWAETPLPILDGKPPSLAVRSEEGRQRAVGLLRSYEESEREAARKDLRKPASYRFLWDSVGLDAETAGG